MAQIDKEKSDYQKKESMFKRPPRPSRGQNPISSNEDSSKHLKMDGTILSASEALPIKFIMASNSF